MCKWAVCCHLVRVVVNTRTHTHRRQAIEHYMKGHSRTLGMSVSSSAVESSPGQGVYGVCNSNFITWNCVVLGEQKKRGFYQKKSSNSPDVNTDIRIAWISLLSQRTFCEGWGLQNCLFGLGFIRYAGEVNWQPKHFLVQIGITARC